MKPKFDFTTIMDRRGKDAMAIDGIGKIPGFAPDAPEEGFDVIPMWVADMNFPTAPSIIAAVKERLEHPAFGYFGPSEEYFDSIIRWLSERHGMKGVTKECIGYENGVLGGVVSALNVMCSRGEGILLHTPCYIGFTSVLKNNGYHPVFSPLVRDQDGIWRMDLLDMEEKIKAKHIHTAIFCSPHNPTGRVWEKKELEEAFALFQKYDVQVISDEIWSDILLSGHTHIPSQMVSEDARMRTVSLYAPSKTFNLAGLVGSYHVIFNKTLRERVDKESSMTHYNSMNVLSMHALIGAYRKEGAEWVDALCEVLTENVRYATDFIRTHFQGVSVSKPEGTYMLFLDCRQWCQDHGKTLAQLEQAGWRVGVAWQDGEMFHGPWSIRMNLALPFGRVQEAMERLQKYVFIDD
ncbi:MAG: aminotransferase class I/II-fold pyridoxal phosphate-dependent enzyme [Eubacterium sp.]|nr:aminotransferase class I/II-fold pyridoxal phosphate-dependent enzyme [Eubacterium sp.]MBQ9022790.1 aminotransferase class I/II-fold pyridoxal phosphate-dependent enzyme [Eubacterium sp.]